MSFRFAVGGALALLASACAGWPGASPDAGPDAAAAACSNLLGTGAAYAVQHAAEREEKLKVIRFASQEAMDAYNATTRGYADQGAELLALRAALDAEYGLPETEPVAAFDHTTDEEATARIEAARTCAAPLIS